MADKTPRTKKAPHRGTIGIPVIWKRGGGVPAGDSPSITVDRIVRAAMKLADHIGLEKFSMRDIASELGCGVMSLYHYVPSKLDLYDLVLDAAMGSMALPERPSGNWRADLHAVAVQRRACLKRHPWLIGLMQSRPAFGPNRLAHFEFSLAAVAGLGLDIGTIQRMVASLYVYTVGFVMMELSAEAKAVRRVRHGKCKAVRPYLRRLLATGAFPHVERLLRESDGPPSGDEAFENGLDLVLDGMATRSHGPGRR
jgi:AcrR family transcriptional regulator